MIENIENPNFDIKKEPSATETIKIPGISVVDQMEITTPEGVSEAFRLKINKRACGAALLEMISKFYQLETTVSAQKALYEIFGTSREDFHQGNPDIHIYPGLGCTLEALKTAGIKIGLLGSETFYNKTPAEILAYVKNGFPTIVEVGARDTSQNIYDHWQSPQGKEYWQLTNGHFVLINGFEKDKITGKYPNIYVADTLNYRWFNSYTFEEFERAAYVKDKAGNKYYWGQGALLKP
ncbi:C39 family peptidase [Patescibacteria group bacterium]|nr:C39 family peptidase [Patescibacteria group bacterium]